MPNVIKSATTVSSGTLKKNNFLLGVNTSVDYGPTSSTNFWNGIVPSDEGYTVYAQKTSQGPSIRVATTDNELIGIATQYDGSNISTVYDALSYFNGQSNYMVTNIDYPNIVTDGLSLNLDAGFLPSYPRTGSTWTDLSGSGNTATLFNSPVYNNQSILFDGVNEYSTIITDFLTNTYTTSIWFTPQAMGNTNALWSQGNTALKIRFSGTQLDYNYASGQVLSGSCSLSSTSWYNVVVTSNGSTVTGYLNNSSIFSSSVSAENPTGTFQIATDSSNNYYNGKISQLLSYNRALSSTELTQNYNSMSSRFTGSTASYYYYGGNYNAVNPTLKNYFISLNSDGTENTSFNVGTGFNDNVESIAIDSNGKILVGGNMSSYNGTQGGYGLMRLNSNGLIDTTLNIGIGFSDTINSIAIDSNGKILVGGWYRNFSGSSQNRLIRLNSDGSKDTTFDIGSGFGSTVWSVATQSDGKILVGGGFTTFTGSTQNCLIRLNSDGSKDSTFNIGSGFNSQVNSIAIQSDGKILAGGRFTSFTGSSQNRLIRLNSDGSKDTTFDIGTGFSDWVESIVIDSNGKILVGGWYSTYRGSSQNRLIRLNTDGSKDTTFDIGTGFDNIIESIAIQSDGKILTGGFFTTFAGSPQNRLIRLNSNGSKDTTFDIGGGFGPFVVESLAINSNGNIFVGGDFTTFSGSTQFRLIRVNTDLTTINENFNIQTGFDGNVESTSINSDGKISVGGSYTTFSGSSQNRLIRLNTDGSKDTTFDIGTGFNIIVYSVATDSNKKTLVGGEFSTFNDSTQNRLIRLNLDGSKDTTFDIGTGFANAGVYSIVLDSNGKILVGGGFTTFTGSSQNRLIRLNSDGSKDTTFDIGTGFGNSIYSISIDSNGKILVGGTYSTFTGSTQNRLIRLNTDGSKDTTFNIGTGFNDYIYTIAIQSDGKILAGGNFRTFTGSTQNRLIRLNTDGSKDTTFDIGTGFNDYIESIVITPNGKILVGGNFTTYKDLPSSYSVTLNNDGSVSDKQIIFNDSISSINYL